jgi:hypothetical protein
MLVGGNAAFGVVALWFRFGGGRPSIYSFLANS